MVDRRAKLKNRSLERGKSAPSFTVPSEDEKQGVKKVDPCLAALKIGHEFKKRSYYQLTYCHHCSELLWGIRNQGYQCTVCNYVTHEKCMPYLVVSCLHLLAESITDPISHKWAGPKDSKKKRKWCNVCRKRIQSSAYFCSVCRLYAHGACRDVAFNNCKRCALFTEVADVPFIHHWIEGNLPSSGKCEVCDKCCSTDLSLSGFRCGWCGICVHSACFDTYMMNKRHEKCTFRNLYNMILPPKAVSVNIKEIINHEEDTVSDDDVCHLFSPTGDDDISTDEDLKGRPVLIIDGSGGSEGYKKWRKRTLHPTYIQKNMCTEEVLRISLRKFGISACPDEYFIAEITHGIERELQSNEIVYNLRQSYNGPLKLYIHKREDESKIQELKIYNSKLSSVVPYVMCDIDEKTTAARIISNAVQLFKLDDNNPNNYCLYETNQSKGVSERIVEEFELPWKRIQELRQDSLRSVSLMRYYLHTKEQQLTILYLWKIPVQYLQSVETAFQYMKDIGIGSDVIKVGPLFPSQASMIVEIKCLTTAQKLLTSLENVKVVPNIHPQELGRDQEPLLVFINTKSGGNQGFELLNGFSRHLNPHQVFDMLEGGPIPGLYAFRHVTSFRILVGGGDGTVGWVLGMLDKMRDILTLPSPPCATLPLGTGNDLARALKWGPGYSGEKLMQILYAVEDANVEEFDRWLVKMTEDIGILPTDSPLTEQNQDKEVVMNNYLGVGLDAEIALHFHQAREERPEKFNSRLHNKGVYLQLGVQKTFSRDGSADLHTLMTLYVDDKKFELPSGLKGIIVLNIQSWGAGSEPWGTNEEQGFEKNLYNDGKLEIMGLNGPMHLGQIKGGIRGGIRLAQGQKVKMILLNSLPIQVDGEAWTQLPSRIEIEKLPYQTCMLVKSPQTLSRSGLSHREAKLLLEKQSIVGNEAKLSGRRDRVSPNSSTLTALGVSTHTLYVKDEKRCQ